MFKLKIIEKKNNNLVLTIFAYDKKVFEKLVKNFSKNKSLNLIKEVIS